MERRIAVEILSLYDNQRKEEEHWKSTREDLISFHKAELDSFLASFMLEARKESLILAKPKGSTDSNSSPDSQLERIKKLEEKGIDALEKLLERQHSEVSQFDSQIEKRWLRLGTEQLEALRNSGFSRAIFCSCSEFIPEHPSIKEIAESVNIIADGIKNESDKQKQVAIFMERLKTLQESAKKRSSPIPPAPPLSRSPTKPSQPDT